MPSAELSAITDALAGAPVTDPTDVEVLRSGYDVMGMMFGVAEGVDRHAAELGEVPGEWFVPHDGATDRTILLLHGGGYVMGSASSHQALASALAVTVPARVFLAEYRLAPEHPFPAALLDASAAYLGLIATGDAARTAVVGDSAGGGLTLALLQQLRDAGAALPSTAVLISPWTDLTQSGSSIRDVGDDDPVLKPAVLDAWAALYVDGADAAAPGPSPLFGDLAGLPPLLVQVAADECLLDDSRRLADQAVGAGVEVALHVVPDVVHHWPVFGRTVPEASVAIDEIAAWIVRSTED